MIRIGGLVVFIRVASKAKIRSIYIIALVAGKAIAGNSCVCSLQRIIIIMDRESGRLPVRISGMAGFTVVGNTYSVVVRIDRLVEIGFMTGKTNGRSPGIAISMTFDTIR